MNDVFITRLRAATMAGWWTVAVAVGFTVLLWVAYLGIMTNRPPWVRCLWGPDVNRADVQHISLWAIAAWKLVVWLLVVFVVWLTLWATQLQKHAAGS